MAIQKKCEGGRLFLLLLFSKNFIKSTTAAIVTIKDDLLYIFSEKKFVFNIILHSSLRPRSIYKSLIHKKEQIWKSS
jgi:hypothetical protein